MAWHIRWFQEKCGEWYTCWYLKVLLPVELSSGLLTVCVFVLERRHLCVWVMLTFLCHPLPWFPSFMLSVNFCRRPLLKFAISRRLRFSLLIFCSASEFRDSSGQGCKRLLLVRTLMVSGKHPCIVLGSFQMHNAQNVSWKVGEVLHLQFHPVNWYAKETM